MALESRAKGASVISIADRLRTERQLALVMLAKRRCRGRVLGLLLLMEARSAYLGIPTADAAEPVATLACAGRGGAMDDTAGHRDVVLMEPDPELSCALRTALGAWGIRVLESRGVSPGPSMPGTSLRARRLAQEYSAAAVVWVSEDTAGFALWIYDAENDRALARPAPRPPFDPSVAAALALSIKTLLRLTGVAHEAPPPAAAPEASVPLGTDLASVESGVAPWAPWEVVLLGAARFGPRGKYRPEARYDVEVRWRVTSLTLAPALAPSHVWLGVALEGGAPRPIRSEEIAGRLWDPSAQLTVGLSHAITGHVALGLSSGVAVFLSELSGTAVRTGSEIEKRRLNSTLLLRPELQLRLGGPLHLVFQPAGAVWLSRQAYLVEGAVLLETPRVSWQLAAGIALH